MRKTHFIKTALLAGVLTAGMAGHGWTSDKGLEDGWPAGE